MDEDEVRALIGLGAETARQRVEGAGCVFRIHREDGLTYPTPPTSQPDRVNVDEISIRPTDQEL